jgi:hypothetical protein
MSGAKKLEAAFEQMRLTGRLSDILPIVGSAERWWAVRHFYPQIGTRMGELRRKAKIDLKAEIIKPAKPSIIRVANIDLLDRINAVVPRGLPCDQRQDVISDMVEAVIAGRLRPDAIAQLVNMFVRSSFIRPQQIRTAVARPAGVPRRGHTDHRNHHGRALGVRFSINT